MDDSKKSKTNTRSIWKIIAIIKVSMGKKKLLVKFWKKKVFNINGPDKYDQFK
jgi:hypothetical protein